MSSRKPEYCQLCERQCELTFHHLIPRKLHRRNYYRKHFNREALNQGVYICRLCHNGIHQLYSEMQLAKHLSSLDLLKNDDSLRKHIQWVAKQKTQ